MKKYEKYKSVDLPWLSEIPKHWDLKRVKDIFIVSRGRVIPKEILNESGLYPVYSSQTQNNGILGYIDTYDFEGERITWTTDGEKAGTVFYRKGFFNCTNICGILEKRHLIKNICYPFYFYVLTFFCKHNRRKDTNGYKIMSNEMKNIFICIPPLEEQKQIAKYLDWKINEIDKLIEKEQIKLSNFNYLRKTLINTVVFQGLDKNKKIYRDIKLTWFKKTPYDWKQVKIKYIFSERVEKNHSEEQFLVSSQSMGVIPKKQYLTRTVEVLKDFHLLKLVKKGDFVISLRSFQGGIEYSDFQGIISPAYTILVLDKNVMLPMYFKYLGKTFDFIQLLKTCVTGIREGQNIDYSKLKNHVISIPTQQEQIDIVNYLDSNIKLIDKIILAYNNKIVLLNELKNSIISEVVTGKIDVRDVIIPKYEKLNVNEVIKEDSFEKGIESDDE